MAAAPNPFPVYGHNHTLDGQSHPTTCDTCAHWLTWFDGSAAEKAGLRLREGDQPLPTPNDEQGIHDRLIEMLEQRKALGLSRYGSLLQPGNGRNAPLDVLEELLDGAAYAMQWQLEREALLGLVAELEAELRVVKRDRATLVEELVKLQLMREGLEK